MAAPLTAALFPSTCPGCGARAEPVCERCAATLVPPPSAPPPAGVDAWAAAFAYEGVARELVARAKYRNAHAATVWLAAAMGMLVPAPVPAMVVWVPTTSRRRRDRGFDHAELLARRVARGIHRPARRVLRREAGLPQTGLAGAARRRGPRIEAIKRVPATVLLVDDVATTGASIASAAAALRRAGACSVFALTAARTPAP